MMILCVSRRLVWQNGKRRRKDFNAVSNSPNDDSLHITAGRKKEGVASYPLE